MRAFLRSLDVLLKFARLHGLDRAQSTDQFDMSWKGLQEAVRAAGEPGLLLGTSRDQLLLNGVPLELTQAERSFAELLKAVGIASIRFRPNVEREEFANLVRMFADIGPKPGTLSEQLERYFGRDHTSGIIVNEIRFVAEDVAFSETRTAAELTARNLDADADPVKESFRSPGKIIQLVAAAENAVGGSGSEGDSGADERAGGVADVTPIGEAEMHSLLQLLARFGEATQSRDLHALQETVWQHLLAALPQNAQVTLRQALASVAARTPTAEVDEDMLLRLGEDLVIRFALDHFQSGEVPGNQVHQMLEKMGHELDTLRKRLRPSDETVASTGLAMESHADVLDRHFWAAVPDPYKRAVLTSPEAWCIPPRNLEQYVEELLGRDESDVAANILLKYAACVRNKDVEARKRTAIGLGQLAELYSKAASQELQDALAQIGQQLCAEKDPELQTLLSTAFVRLSQEAAQQRYYPAMQQALDFLSDLEELRPMWSQSLRPRIGVESRLADFIEEALTAEKASNGLAGVLMRVPEHASEQLAVRLAHAGRRSERERIINLAKTVGNACPRHLIEVLKAEQAAKAASVVGLLSRLDPVALENLLPTRLRHGARGFHDAVVRQLAIAGADERGRLLVDSLDLIDPMVLPLALDEIGMCGDLQTAPKLLRLADGEVLPQASDFLRVKAIEALGRMRAPAAAGHLRRFVEARKSFGWAYPEEIRTAAAQALEKIDPSWTRDNLPRLGFDERALAIVPLDPAPDRDVVRHRRYQRIRLPRNIPAVITSPRGKYSSAISVLSLDGGLLSGDIQMAVNTEATLKIPAGLGSISMRAVVRYVRSDQAGFETVGMRLDDRAKLRRLLVSLSGEAMLPQGTTGAQ